MDFEIIWKKVHASLSPAEEEAFHAWLEESEDHRRYFENVKSFYTQGSALEKDPVDLENAWAKLSESMEEPKRGINRKLIFVLGMAASIVLVMLVWFFTLQPAERTEMVAAETKPIIEPGSHKAVLILDDSSVHDLSSGQGLSLHTGGVQINSEGTSLEYKAGENSNKEIKYNTLKIPRGGEFFLSLSDGTKVWLNSETTLRFPVQFGGDSREVELTGEAYFEVTKSNIPFRVVSGQQVVQVLGTQFNVSSYPEDQTTTTTLVEGKVNVYLGNDPTIVQTLTPRLQSQLLKSDGTITTRQVDTEEFTAWKEGRFYFKDQSLSQIMKTLSRWYDVDVTFDNKKAQQMLFTGNIKRHEDFENILDLIAKTNEVKFEIEGRSINVK